MNDETPSTDGADERECGTDPVPALATALAGYLMDVERDCRECLRQEPVVEVVTMGGDICLSWVVNRTVTAHLRRLVEGLPGWNHSPFWSSDRTRLEALEAWSGCVALAPKPGHVVCRGVSWHGRPVRIEASPGPGAGCMTIVLLLPDVYREWPELALRRLADAIRCYTSLVPNNLAQALPLASRPTTRTETVVGFLTRAMPPNLYASQCFARLKEQN